MAFLDPFRDDPQRSVRLDFEKSLAQGFDPLLDWLTGEVLRFHRLLRARPTTISQIRRTSASLIANFIHTADLSADCFLAVSMAAGAFTRNRYNQHGIGFDNFVRVIEALRDAASPLIVFVPGHHFPLSRRTTRIRPTARLFRILTGYLDRLDRDELPRGAFNFVADNFHLDLMLPDDDFLNLFANRNRQANEREIFFGDQPSDIVFVDLTRTRLHRVFNNGTFDEGGRFYGAWWQSIPSEFRRFITINGVATVEIDYSGLHANMLYAIEHLPLPENPYRVEGIAEEYRKLIKATFFKLINAQPGQRIRPPLAGRLPVGWSWQQLQDAIVEKHRPIHRHLRSGVGLRLQRIDSDIAERVMSRMQAADRLVLPVHDSFRTYVGLTETLREEMAAAYRDRMRAEIEMVPEPAFVRDLYDAAADEQLGEADLVDWQQAQPGYDGYRRRQQVFLDSRTAEWHQRFGDHQIN